MWRRGDISIDVADEMGIVYVCRNLRPLDHKEAFAIRPRVNELHLAQDMAKHQALWCVRYRGRPTAIVGASEMWPGMWEIFLLTTEDFPKVVLSFTKFVRKGIIPALFQRGAHRAQLVVLSEYEQAKGLLRILGAKPLAELRRFGRNKEDYEIFQWLEEDVAECLHQKTIQQNAQDRPKKNARRA